MSRSVTVALDVDGVVCPVVHPDDVAKVEARTGWAYPALPHPVDRLVTAEPVRRTLVELEAASRGERSGSEEGPVLSLKWHTSWWRDAEALLAPALGLTSLAQNAMFATDAEHDDGYSSLGHWWKLTAVHRWLDEHQDGDDLLVWVDDDIDYAIRSGEISAALVNHPRLAMISPATHRGINHLELARLRELTGLDPAAASSRP